MKEQFGIISVTKVLTLHKFLRCLILALNKYCLLLVDGFLLFSKQTLTFNVDVRGEIVEFGGQKYVSLAFQVYKLYF